MVGGNRHHERELFVDYFEPVSMDPAEIADPELRAAVLAHAASAQIAHADYLAVLNRAHQRDRAKRAVHRDTANWLADEIRTHRNTAGRDVNLARLIHHHHPRIGESYRNGRINADHLRLFTRIWNQRALRPYLERDLDILLGWATSPWVECIHLFRAWEVLVDPVDPNDLAAQAHDKRRFNYTRNGHQLICELDTTTAHFATIEAGLRAKVAELFEADWAEAQARVGSDASLDDLLRTDTERWHDALMSLLHSGIATDPGTAHVTANIVMDSDTAIAEAERRDAQAVGLPAPVRATNDATERARTYRCETLSGMPLAPADALDFALAGYVRKFVFETETSDFTASERARLFKGAKRVGIMIRDRHCQGAGCSTHASYCEADHTIRHIDGGPTVPTNGRARCGPCHRHKTRLESLGIWPGG
ncbi:MAG: HNH endonuclease signature motif containing protein [Acidimicrobiales bacterium]